MKRSRFTEEQIIGILRENEAGATAAELARKHGVSEGTIYAWKAKFGGMSVSEAQRLHALAFHRQQQTQAVVLQRLGPVRMADHPDQRLDLAVERGFTLGGPTVHGALLR